MPLAWMLAAFALMNASLCGVLGALFGCFLSLLSGMKTSVPVTVAGVAVVSMAMVVMILLLLGLGFRAAGAPR